MNWPTTLTYGQIERITEETNRLGMPFDPIACYEGDEPTSIMEWNKFAGNTKTCIAVLFWWTFKGDEKDTAAVTEKSREFKAAMMGGGIKAGRDAFQKALDAFSLAAGMNAAFGKMAEKVQSAAEVLMKRKSEVWDTVTPDALCQMATGAAKSGDSQEASEKTHADTPTGS